MRCVDNSRKHFNYEYGNGKNCSKTVLAQLFKTCIQILGGAQFSKHILSNVVGGMQPYKIFSVLLGLGNNENTDGGP